MNKTVKRKRLKIGVDFDAWAWLWNEKSGDPGWDGCLNMHCPKPAARIKTWGEWHRVKIIKVKP